MKKPLLLLTLALTGTMAFAQNERPNIIKTHPMGYFIGQYQFGYERALSDNFSIVLNGGGIYRSQTALSSVVNGSSFDFDRQVTGFIAIPEARYYFTGDAAPEGAYLGLFGRFRQVNAEWSTNLEANTEESNEFVKITSTRQRTAIGGGLLIGYQFMGKGGMTFDIFAGPQFKDVSSKVTYDMNTLVGTVDGEDVFPERIGIDWNWDRRGTGLRFGFSVGYAF
jgi:hypothetical protein